MYKTLKRVQNDNKVSDEKAPKCMQNHNEISDV